MSDRTDFTGGNRENGGGKLNPLEDEVAVATNGDLQPRRFSAKGAIHFQPGAAPQDLVSMIRSAESAIQSEDLQLTSIKGHAPSARLRFF